MVSFPSTLISRIAFIRTNAFIIIIINNFSSSTVQEVPRRVRAVRHFLCPLDLPGYRRW